MKTVVLWGAGATASLGLATTERQSSFWRSLLDETRNPTRKSYRSILSLHTGGLFGEYEDNVADLLELLDDTRDDSSRGKLRNHGLVHFSEVQEKIVRKYRYDLGGVVGMAEDRIILEKAKDRVVMMRLYYDWSALMLIMRTQYNNKSDDAKDDKFVECVYNVIDLPKNECRISRLYGPARTSSVRFSWSRSTTGGEKRFYPFDKFDVCVRI